MGDRAVVSVLVRVTRPEAFRLFTEEIDRWWRAGLKFRNGTTRSVVHLEPKLGGRLFETFGESPTVVETGVVTVFDPPSLLELKWRAANFAPHESTHLAVRFDEQPSGTLVTVTHSRWSSIRDDHPVRHGQTPAAFVRTLGLWWGEQLTSLRLLGPP
jgi:Activator of Hsp90 ATPase homolog 1-like protein